MRLEYYLEDKYKDVFAYDEKTEFFCKYIKSEKKWEKCKFSFMAFMHDLCVKELTEEKAKEYTEGSLPLKEFADYKETLKRNVQGI